MSTIELASAPEGAARPQAGWRQPARRPLLFLISDTGGGHRSAARAVAQALDRLYPGRFGPVLCDPLGGPGSARLLRWVAGLYGPAIRLAPWLWGAAYRATDSRTALRVLRRTLLRLADRPVLAAARAHRPAAVVSFHPLTGAAAVAARDRAAPGSPTVTVITDLARTHAAWRHGGPDLIIAPSAAPPAPGGPPWMPAALPVTREFWGGPLRSRDERAALRRSLSVREDRFLVLLTGGGEGSGGIGRRAAAILRRLPEVDVVAVCGRNRRLRQRLESLAAGSGGRLTVTGFTRDMADWLRCCDLVVTKAGPGTIAEATCCGAPMLLTSHVPGQERGNAEFVTRAGAGRRARRVRRLLAEIEDLRADADGLAVMRAASARLGRPGAAATIAEQIAALAGAGPPAGAADGAGPAGAADGAGPAGAADGAGPAGAADGAGPAGAADGAAAAGAVEPADETAVVAAGAGRGDPC
jgi:1,2-diacylglycerol 3-beta-galactosyltransferase